jgi:hypothetical protein
MPLDPKAPVGQNIAELHTGKTYAATKKKKGKKRADKQAVAIALSTKRRQQGTFSRGG